MKPINNAALGRSFCRLMILALAVGFVMRIVLMFNEQTLTSFHLLDILRIFAFGFVNDFCVAFIGTAFAFVNLIFISSSKYRKPYNFIILGVLVLVLCYLLFLDRAFTEFNKNVVRIVCYVLMYKCVSFALRAFVPSIRKGYSKTVFILTLFIYVAAVLINAIGEYFFWSEFGVRYNFIAVDYLIYTNEVIGNIIESYPVVPIFSTIGIVAIALTYLIVQDKWHITMPSFNLLEKLRLSGAYVLVFVVSCLGISGMTYFQSNANVYVNELQANGLYKFYEAFWSNKIEYDRFYQTLPKQQVAGILNKMYGSSDMDNTHLVTDSMPELHKNIVLIMVESLSAEYLTQFGNTEHITPYLDALSKKSISIDNLFANGNRTVRGLEAVTLCIPPSPGESIIKRPNNTNLFSVATVLKQKGYTVQFLYGGDSYFDNMKEFFSGNGYQVIDKKSMSPEEVTFSTVWGACDENLFDKALKVFDADAASGKPFFAHIMTTSNHRPYLYPEGKIDISPKTKSRRGGVKYTDYAIGKFLQAASRHAWFANTVFVVVADHCASSAGSTQVPLDQYHIPAFIYAPGFVQPQKVTAVTSQMDIMPTVFGLLHFSYTSKFYGQDMLKSTYKPRAVVATYQNLGYLRDGIFTILSSPRHAEQFKPIFTSPTQCNMTPLKTLNKQYLDEAIAHYQSIEYRK